MVTLIANPKQVDRQSVRVVGVLSVGERGTALYAGREAYEYSIDSDAIFIGTTFTDAVLLARFSGHYVQVTGEFDADGVAPPFAGQLHDVLPIVPANVRLPWRQLETELHPGESE
jgi:hypothetical protein